MKEKRTMRAEKAKGGWEYSLDRVTFRQWLTRDNVDNSNDYNYMLKMMRVAIREELTPKQQLYVEEYFLNGIPMVDIAGEHGVNVSTISRTISRAKKTLERTLRYCSPTILRASLDGSLHGESPHNTYRRGVNV